jgi:hypothetical protein
MTNVEKTKRNGRLMSVILLCLGISLPASAQFGDALNAAGKLIRKGKEANPPTEKKTGAEPSLAQGGSVMFSSSPIHPDKPESTSSSFKVGDCIYALIQTEKTWSELFGKGDPDVKEIQVPIDMIVDGQNVDFQYITIKDAAAIASKVLVLEIAPDPATMTSYKDEGFVYGEGKGNRKIGPDQYTYILSTLAPGKHVIRIQVRSYGDIFSVGEMTIAGDNYQPYANVREKILAEMLNVGGMPKAQKADVQLEAQMMKLLLNAGWKNIRKLVIVDKDWWNDLVAGGDSAVVGRHIAAAVAAKLEDGTFCWCNITFEQKKLIDGSFGPLELSRTGEKRPIKEENIDR